MATALHKISAPNITTTSWETNTHLKMNGFLYLEVEKAENLSRWFSDL